MNRTLVVAVAGPALAVALALTGSASAQHRNGVARELGKGDLVMATKDTTHWWANKGDVPVVLLPVDVFKP